MVTTDTYIQFIQSWYQQARNIPAAQAEDLALAAVESPMWQALFAQAFHETGAFTSRLFRQCHNLFGFGCAGWSDNQSGHTTADGGRCVACYAQPGHSIDDIIKWLARKNIDTPATEGDVYTFFQQIQRAGFNPSATYPDLLLNVYNRLKSRGIFDKRNSSYTGHPDPLGDQNLNPDPPRGGFSWFFPALLVGGLILLKPWQLWKSGK